MTTQSEEETTCCPKFDPIPWDDTISEWENKKFIKDSVFTLFYMPMNFGKVMMRLDKKMIAAGERMPGFLCLSDHTSSWNMDIYLEVDKEIPNVENTTLTGRYYSKVFEGPFKDTGKWNKEFTGILKSKGLNSKRRFALYTTCPKCAKKYGKNYVVLLSQVE